MRFYLASELIELERLLTEKLEPWMDKWFSPTHEKTISGIEASVKSDNLRNIEGIYFDLEGEDLAEVFSAKAQLELDEKTKNIYAHLWRKSIVDLKELIGIKDVLSENKANEFYKLGSGAVSIYLTVSRMKISLVLSSQQISQLISEPKINLDGCGPLISCKNLINENLKLNISTQPITLGYQQVQSLKVGDKLILKHKVDQPLNVEVSNKNIATAYIAACSGKKAIVMEGK